MIDLSIVIPVFNGSATVEGLVDEIHSVFAGRQFEVVLVDDGSADDSEQICLAIAKRCTATVSFVQLSRNFGEHNAVLAGLGRTNGQYAGILDDDGQNPPAELLRMWLHIQETRADVVYGRYRVKQHGWLRNLGSRLNGFFATALLGKPRDLYFSSFKVMARPLVREVLKYQGPFPYLDGLIYRSTGRIDQIDVDHRRRTGGRSGYTPGKLVRLWLNMSLASLVPLRFACLLGGLAFCVGIVLLVGVVVEHVWRNPGAQIDISGVLAGMLLLSGIQLIILGMVGEYAGRIFLHQSGWPPYVIRYVQVGDATRE